MKLLVDTSRVQFQVTKEPDEKRDQNGTQKVDRKTGELLFIVQVMALDESGGDILTVTVAGAKPRVQVGQVVRPVELEAIPWATNGRSGTAFRAKSIETVQASKAA